MSDPLDPQTLAETNEMDGTINSVAVDSVGTPTVILWIEDDATGDVHQINGSLETDAVAAMGMLQLLRDAVVHKLSVRIRWTEATGMKWFHLVRLL